MAQPEGHDDDAPLPALVPPSPDVRDEVRGPCCCVCGKELRGTLWVCVACKKEHGLPRGMSAWPEWAKFLAASEHARRRSFGLDSWVRVGY